MEIQHRRQKDLLRQKQAKTETMKNIEPYGEEAFKREAVTKPDVGGRETVMHTNNK